MMNGPKILFPGTISEMFNFQYDSDGKLVDATLRTEWVALFNSVQQVAFNVSRSGPTASRPTSSLPGRFIGMPFMDMTLGIPVWLKSVNPDVWVNGAGTTV